VPLGADSGEKVLFARYFVYLSLKMEK